MNASLRRRWAGRIPPLKRSESGGFTLVELLVVMAVIAILAALLLPALLSAKSASKSAACKSNLRQIGIALASYSDDFGAYPLDRDRVDAPTWWVQRLGPYTASRWPNDYFWRRDGGSSIYACADYRGRYSNGEGPGFALQGSYGYNAWGAYLAQPQGALGLGGTWLRQVPAGSEDFIVCRQASIVRPVGMVAVADAVLWKWPGERFGDVWDHRSHTYYGFGEIDLAVARYPFPAQGRNPGREEERRRHGGIFNVGFCDGHVEGIKGRVLFDSKADAALRRWLTDNQPHREFLWNTFPGPY